MAVTFQQRLKAQLAGMGVSAGDIVLVHTSLKGLNTPRLLPDDVIGALLELLTPKGTLLVPALSYASVTALNPVFHLQKTPSCIGALPERFRTRYAEYRSLHPTHSVCARGKHAYALTAYHSLDSTPVGEHSPFMQLPAAGGKILMLGCGLRPNTFLHGVEEYARAPYPLAKETLVYTLTNQEGAVTRKAYRPHHFGGLIQRYDRLSGLLGEPELIQRPVLGGTAWLIDAAAALACAAEQIHVSPYYFVERPLSGRPL